MTLTFGPVDLNVSANWVSRDKTQCQTRVKWNTLRMGYRLCSTFSYYYVNRVEITDGVGEMSETTFQAQSETHIPTGK